MHWLTILLIGIAANLDNLGISISYGLKSSRIPFLPNVLIALLSMISAYLSIVVGSFLSHYLTQSIANFAGGFLIFCLGIRFFITSPTPIKPESMREEVPRFHALSDLGNTKEITWKESIFLGFVLAINCFTIGFGAGITGVSPVSAAISIGIFSIISISLGVRLGYKIGNTLFGKYANHISGLLLIIIGLYEMFI